MVGIYYSSSKFQSICLIEDNKLAVILSFPSVPGMMVWTEEECLIDQLSYCSLEG